MTITVHHFLGLCSTFAAKHGRLFRDRETGGLMNPEEAVCRYLYGARWWDTEDFLSDDQLPADQLPDKAVTAIVAMTENLPDWMVPVKTKATTR